MSTLVLPRDIVPGRLYRFRHKTRGVFEARVRVVGLSNPRFPRDWYTCDVTKGNRHLDTGQIFGGYFDLVDVKEIPQ